MTSEELKKRLTLIYYCNITFIVALLFVLLGQVFLMETLSTLIHFN